MYLIKYYACRKKFEMKFANLIEKYIICLVGTHNFLPDEPL